MSDAESPRRYRMTIDRVVVDGAPGVDVQKDAFRRLVAAEVQRLLAEHESTEPVRADQSQQRVTHSVAGGEKSGPAQVARSIVPALPSFSSQPKW